MHWTDIKDSSSPFPSLPFHIQRPTDRPTDSLNPNKWPPNELQHVPTRFDSYTPRPARSEIPKPEVLIRHIGLVWGLMFWYLVHGIWISASTYIYIYIYIYIPTYIYVCMCVYVYKARIGTKRRKEKKGGRELRPRAQADYLDFKCI